MADISNINLPNGENYDIKDKVARNNIAINRTTLGTQCKNLLKNNAVTKTINGITFTVNDDKSITVTGKANDSTEQTIFIFTNNSTLKKTIKSGKYILSGCPSGGSSSTYRMFAYHINPSTNIADDGNGVTGNFDYSNTTDSNIAIVIAKGYTDNINLTFYPMLRYADITDDTYEPYKESVDERIDKNASDIAINKSTLGYQCKNMLDNTAVTKTVNGITFTVNDDKSVTVNGTATATAQLVVGTITKDGNYILTGCPSGGSASTYMLSLTYYKVSGNTTYGDETGSGCSVVFDSEKYSRINVIIQINKGVTVSNKTFYPMLRYADIIDDTYEPYQPSLQERITALEERIAALGG